MIQPRERAWDVGRDAYRRAVVLHHRREASGKEAWKIVTQASDQRDEGEHIRSLSLANHQAIAEILAQEKP